MTVSLDAAAEEFIDFYFDDPTRPTWVRAGLIAWLTTEFLEAGASGSALMPRQCFYLFRGAFKHNNC